MGGGTELYLNKNIIYPSYNKYLLAKELFSNPYENSNLINNIIISAEIFEYIPERIYFYDDELFISNNIGVMTNAAITGLTISNNGTAPSITYKVCFDNQPWVDNYQYCNGQFNLNGCTTYLQFQNSDGEMVDIFRITQDSTVIDAYLYQEKIVKVNYSTPDVVDSRKIIAKVGLPVACGSFNSPTGSNKIGDFYVGVFDGDPVCINYNRFWLETENYDDLEIDLEITV